MTTPTIEERLERLEMAVEILSEALKCADNESHSRMDYWCNCALCNLKGYGLDYMIKGMKEKEDE